MYNEFFIKENQFKRKSTRYIDLNLTFFFPLYSTRTLQVNIFINPREEKKTIYTS